MSGLEFQDRTNGRPVVNHEEIRISQPLHIKAGDHLELDYLPGQGSGIVPYQHVKMLGHGGSASVEEVRDSNTGLVYARKIIRNVYTRNLDKAKQQLLNEVQIMQRLASHHHIIRVHATYIMKRELAIILEPAADGGDLASFLQDYRDSGYSLSSDEWGEPLEQNRILRKAYGCLTSGLAFMHRQTIRHKDIKPQNILIHQEKFIYTDFGLSYDYGDIGQSTTTGFPQGLTKRYCAPEVADWGSRNSKSDIFSLGCVLIEINAALEPEYGNDRLLDGNFHETLRARSEEDLFTYEWGWDVRLDMIRSMVQIDPIRRPSAMRALELLFVDGHERDDNFCVQCIEAQQSIGSLRSSDSDEKYTLAPGMVVANAEACETQSKDLGGVAVKDTDETIDELPDYEAHRRRRRAERAQARQRRLATLEKTNDVTPREQSDQPTESSGEIRKQQGAERPRAKQFGDMAVELAADTTSEEESGTVVENIDYNRRRRRAERAQAKQNRLGGNRVEFS
ncbi:kinase-like protein [Cucurbitaria berberidis CBS 394.84]|uniref:Kinase-like protein n=1 Tax=Cucurbitaria berberidis CBS 394.84 TaxID=1168544 RepID=A0A9P4GA63_9PLEO|nr:kinase-like protein [Cucurbitaria berberidis CBS 394.84]KAF1842013.1 kinase-like protein [Cucurbitaria berberidis CBS 394.84]